MCLPVVDAGAGGEVCVSPVMGKGFRMERAPAADHPTCLLFATGSGISPIKALIESTELQVCLMVKFHKSTSAVRSCFSVMLDSHNASCLVTAGLAGATPFQQKKVSMQVCTLSVQLDFNIA